MNTTALHLAMIGVGPQRTATTWLYVCLQEHPQLCFPSGVKQTFFLDRRFDKGWAWYWSHFRHRRDGQLCAEIGPTYFHTPEVGVRLQQHNPDCRIIITLRDPVARSFSEYLHHRKKGRLNCDFRDAVLRMPEILDASRYRIHTERWRELFGPERVLILLQEDIASAPQQVLAQVYALAGVGTMPLPRAAWEQVNNASLPSSPLGARLAARGADWLRERRLYGPIEFAKALGGKRIFSGFRGTLPTLDPQIRRELVGEFTPDVMYVEELLQRPLPAWRQIL